MQKESMKVLVITNTYPTEKMPGDTPCIADQVEYLKSMGAEVDILLIDRQKKINYFKQGIRAFILNLMPRVYDIVHAFYGHSGLLARLQIKSPVVVTYRGSDLLSGKDAVIGKVIARLVDRVIVMSEEMKVASRRTDAYIIPFGVNTEVFQPYPMMSARQELGLPENKKLVLFPWNPIRKEKRIDIVEKVIAQLQTADPNVDLVVIHDKKPQEVMKYMNACDVLVLASDHEGSPVAIREAMACNLPIVSVDVGDVRELITGLENCYIADQDVQDIAVHIERVFNHNVRSNGVEKIMDYDAEAAAKQVYLIYLSMLDGKSED